MTSVSEDQNELSNWGRGHGYFRWNHEKESWSCKISCGAHDENIETRWSSIREELVCNLKEPGFILVCVSWRHRTGVRFGSRIRFVLLKLILVVM